MAANKSGERHPLIDTKAQALVVEFTARLTAEAELLATKINLKNSDIKKVETKRLAGPYSSPKTPDLSVPVIAAALAEVVAEDLVNEYARTLLAGAILAESKPGGLGKTAPPTGLGTLTGTTRVGALKRMSLDGARTAGCAGLTGAELIDSLEG